MFEWVGCHIVYQSRVSVQKLVKNFAYLTGSISYANQSDRLRA
jgi:hypothetical protein